MAPTKPYVRFMSFGQPVILTTVTHMTLPKLPPSPKLLCSICDVDGAAMLRLARPASGSSSSIGAP